MSCKQSKGVVFFLNPVAMHTNCLRVRFPSPTEDHLLVLTSISNRHVHTKRTYKMHYVHAKICVHTCIYIYLQWNVYVLVLGSYMKTGEVWILQHFLVSVCKVLLNSTVNLFTIICLQRKPILTEFCLTHVVIGQPHNSKHKVIA